jgi:hypothetical protein
MTSILSGSWILILVWLGLFSLDNYLTVYVAGLYQRQDPKVIHFEGGYELTPQYKAEVKGLKLFGPRFIRSAVITTVFMSFVWFIVNQGWTYPVIYSLGMGAIILLAVVVNLRHIQNIPFFKSIGDTEKAKGEIFYSHVMIYRGSAIAFMAHAGFFLLIAILESSWFFVGGALSCAAMAVNHYRLSGSKPELVNE